jgi:hypothetical protein
MHVASSQIPPFPGRQYTCDTRGDWCSFHTSACSLPPPPITRTFIDKVVPEMPKNQTCEDIAFSADSSAYAVTNYPKHILDLELWLTLLARTAPSRWTRSKKTRSRAATCGNINAPNADASRSSIAARRCGRSCQRRMRNRPRDRDGAAICRLAITAKVPLDLSVIRALSC